MYVIETDRPCKWCGSEHGVVTRSCQLVVFTEYADAMWVNQSIDGVVRAIRDVPDGVDYQLFTKAVA